MTLAEAEGDVREPITWFSFVWLLIGFSSFALVAAVAYDPAFDSAGATALSLIPFVVLLAMTVVFSQPVIEIPQRVALVATGIAIGGWAIIVFSDDRWTILTFAMYSVCYSAGRSAGLWLAALVSAAWAASWYVDGSPIWTLVIPVGVFFVSGMISLTLYRAGEVNNEQAELIRRLTEAQRDLAISERSKGILEERSRFASEIHDTLAQGFTSIVLLSRAAQRTGETTDGLISIEETAQENLEAARRLVEAIKPPELETGSLPDALDRHRDACLPPEIQSTLRVVGTPRQLTGAVEVTLLRAAQEALLNVRTHAEASNVDITLSYLDGLVALDVRDDGIGFEAGRVSDRGSLTGGQGLRVLERRAESLSGNFAIEPLEGGGSVVSVQLPAVGQ